MQFCQSKHVVAHGRVQGEGKWTQLASNLARGMGEEFHRQGENSLKNMGQYIIYLSFFEHASTWMSWIIGKPTSICRLVTLVHQIDAFLNRALLTMVL
jgi:hypothetical protein